MELHPDERVVFEGHPSWRAVLSFYIGGVAGAALIGAIVWLAVGWFVALLAFAVLIALVILFGLIKRTATSYMVSNQRLYIRRGILAKKVQQTRIDRVQNVNTEQSLRERLLRVGTVDFDTAGSDDSEFRFVGSANRRPWWPPWTARRPQPAIRTSRRSSPNSCTRPISPNSVAWSTCSTRITLTPLMTCTGCGRKLSASVPMFPEMLIS
jgi:membrane protein YdbS with pleckstrin-like domain